MVPKLIILNGPLGSGKSTLAKRYAMDNPLTLQLDIDNIWSMISHWREEIEISAPLSKKISIEMARVHLKAGYNVIVPQIVQTNQMADSFETLAHDCGAIHLEILLYMSKDEAIKRFIDRNIEAGFPTGFREGGVIATNGKETKLATMYDAMIDVTASRSKTIITEPIYGDIEATYEILVDKINAA